MAQCLVITDLIPSQPGWSTYYGRDSARNFQDAVTRGRIDQVKLLLQTSKAKPSHVTDAIMACQDNILSLLLENQPELITVAITELTGWNAVASLGNLLYHLSWDGINKYSAELNQAKELAKKLGYDKVVNVIEQYSKE